MSKKLVLIISIVACLVGCSNQTIIKKNTKESNQKITATVPSSTTTIEPYITPTKQYPISDTSNLKKKWNPNHGIVDIKYKNIGHYDDTEEYVFISNTEGWKGYIAPVGAGQDSLILFKTTDGGKHWSEITDSNNASTDITGGDIVFINSKAGWIIHNIPQNSKLTLYKTVDGGVTWEEQDINTPQQYSNIEFSVCLPVFFSQADGIMFASCKDSANNYKNVDSVAFITHDGGKTWNLNSENADEIIKWSINEKKNSKEVIYNKEKWKSIDNVEWNKIRSK